MADPPAYEETGHNTGVEPDRGSSTGPPRWVKVFGIVALVLVVTVAVLHLTGRGFSHHDHTGSDDGAETDGHGGQAGHRRHTHPEAGRP